jgi:hypothetical protein
LLLRVSGRFLFWLFAYVCFGCWTCWTANKKNNFEVWTSREFMVFFGFERNWMTKKVLQLIQMGYTYNCYYVMFYNRLKLKLVLFQPTGKWRCKWMCWG